MFWAYFNTTWMKIYDTETWNVHSVDEAIVNRTNNPLEQNIWQTHRKQCKTHKDGGQHTLEGLGNKEAPVAHSPVQYCTIRQQNHVMALYRTVR
jgi:hypothetical protein